jgi:hypothetical protein
MNINEIVCGGLVWIILARERGFVSTVMNITVVNKEELTERLMKTQHGGFGWLKYAAGF